MLNDDDASLSDQTIAEIISGIATEIGYADKAQRQAAIRDLSDLCREVGVRARAAIPIWLELLADESEETGEWASYGLGDCAPDSIEPLIERLRHNNPTIRERACSSLATAGKEALLAADRILPLLADPIEKVRSRAAWALGHIGDARQRTIAALFEMVRSGTIEDRRAALHGLGNLAKAAGHLAPFHACQRAIFDALQDEDEDVRWGACYVIESLDLDPATHVALIAPRLSDRSEEVKHIAIGQLKKLAHDIDITSHLAAICQIVRDADRFSATIACEVIGQLGSRAHAAVPSLLDALNSKDAYIVIAAAEALWRVERRVDVALPHLAMLFPEHGETVCDVITQIGPAAAPLIGQVIAALESDEWDLQWAAAAAAELLRAQLHSSRPGLAAWSAIALAKITGDEMTVPMLVKLLEQVDRDELRYQAAVALEAIGPRALAAVPALNTLRDDPDDQIRTAVEAALSAVSAARH